MKPQKKRFLILWVKSLSHKGCPQPSRRPKFGDLLEEIVVTIEKERHAGRHIINR
jgi:hypothetical protein